MFLNLLTFMNDAAALFIVVPLIFGVGLYLTFRLGCLQITQMKRGISHLIFGDGNVQGNISQFEAISTVLAGNLGTGNISGMAVALTTGGPGALVWMWVMAFLGAIIKYAGCLLGVKYRHVNPEGEYVGGPMYYLAQGLNFKLIAWLFSCFAILTAFTVGNLVQVNSIVLPMKELGLNPLYFGVAIAFLVGFVLIGGVQRFALVASTVVPMMATLYLGVAILILGLHADRVLGALELMFTAAFDFSSISGGILGYSFLHAIRIGFERGVFATDAGVGIAPILQSSARTKSPVIEGIVAMVAPFVVMIVCTLTGLVLIVTDAWTDSHQQSTNMCTWAFEKGLGSPVGAYVVIISLILFAFTTILAWAYCGEKAVEYLWGLKKMKWFQYIFVILIPFGTLFQVETVWKLADVFMALMLLTNMIGIIGLSREVIAESEADAKSNLY